MLAWSIAAARESGVCERVIVSTEDAEIAEIARAHGAEAPFLRPPELARDDVQNQAAVDHAVAWLEAHDGYLPAAVFVLQPTSPFRAASDVRRAAELLEEKGAAGVVSVSLAETSPHLFRQLDADSRFTAWRAASPPPVDARQREPLYRINGAIYLDRLPAPAATEPPVALIMPPERSLDIDTPWDLRLAEAVLSLA